MRSISSETSLRPMSPLFMSCYLPCRLKRRDTDSRRGIFDRNREPDADEDALFAWIEDGGDDPHDLAVHRDQRAARVSGIGCGVELDEIGQRALVLGRSVGALQSRDDACRRGG